MARPTFTTTTTPAARPAQPADWGRLRGALEHAALYNSYRAAYHAAGDDPDAWAHIEAHKAAALEAIIAERRAAREGR